MTTKSKFAIDKRIRSRKIVADIPGTKLQMRVKSYMIRHDTRRIPQMAFCDHTEGAVLMSLLRRMRGIKEEHKLYRTMLDAISKDLGLKHDDGKIKMSWSNFAGCRCGCSPAFIAKSLEREYSGLEFFVDYVIEKK